MYDLISVGGISIDLYFKGDTLTFKDDRFQLAIGGKYLVDEFHVGIGGGGANVAIGAKKNGLHTAVLGIIGNNIFKKIILAKLVENDVSYSLCSYEDNFYNVSMLLLSPNGERSIVHYTTPRQHILGDSNDLRGITKTKMIFLGSLSSVSLEERVELLQFYREKGVKTILNLNVQDCRRPLTQLMKLFSKTDVLIINGHEFSEIVKAPYKDIHFKDHVVQWYIPSLADTLVVVTEGEKGSYAYIKDAVFHQPAEHITKIIDTTGAGDGFTAAFIAEYYKSGNIVRALEKGSHYAAKILMKIGAN